MEGPLFITPKGADEPMSLAPSSSFAQPGLDTTPKRLGGVCISGAGHCVAFWPLGALNPTPASTCTFPRLRKSGHRFNPVVLYLATFNCC